MVFAIYFKPWNRIARTFMTISYNDHSLWCQEISAVTWSTLAWGGRPSTLISEAPQHTNVCFAVFGFPPVRRGFANTLQAQACSKRQFRLFLLREFYGLTLDINYCGHTPVSHIFEAGRGIQWVLNAVFDNLRGLVYYCERRCARSDWWVIQ